MFLSKAVIFPVLLTLSSATVDGLKERDNSVCTEVHLFLARGNGEAYPGRVGALANAVCNGLPSCDSENIIFDSSQSYCDQASDGVASGLSQIAAYSSRCPTSKLVIGGYSLGAQIVGDIVGGGGGSFYNCVERSNAGLSVGSGPGSHVAAVLLFGDVRHTANQAYNVGPGSGDNGQYPRSGSQLSNLNQFSGKLRSYCLATDPICALGDDGLSHETYMDVYANAAAAWTQQILDEGESASSSIVIAEPTSTSASTSTAESTSASESASESESASTSTWAYTSTLEFTSSSGSSSASTWEYTSTVEFTSTSTPTAAASSSFTSAAASSTTPSLTSGPVQESTTSSADSSASTPYSLNTASLTPFVFSNTATVATTSTFLPTIATFAPTNATFSSTTSVSTSSESSTPTVATVVTSSSEAGAYPHSVQLTLSLISLVVIKVLAF